MRKNQNYTGDFKVKVAQAYLFDHLGGYQSVAEHFGVTNRKYNIGLNCTRTILNFSIKIIVVDRHKLSQRR